MTKKPIQEIEHNWKLKNIYNCSKTPKTLIAMKNIETSA